MSTSTIVRTMKCSKPAGQYCRLHNPAPVTPSFVNVNDVFNKIAEETSKRKNIQKVIAGESFQGINETRYLPESIPEDIEEHITLSKEALSHLSSEQINALSGYTGYAANVCNTTLLGKEYQYRENVSLWKETANGPSDFVNREDLVDYMETMDSLLGVRQEKQRIVYRGIPIYSSLHDEIGASIGKDLYVTDTEGLMEGLKEYYKPGKTFNYPTYLSTSLSANHAAERTTNTIDTKSNYVNKAEILGIQFEMKTNAGLDVTGIARSHNAGEREVALPRDTHFKVVNVHVRPESYNTVSGFDFEPGEREQENFKQVAVVVQMVEVDVEGNEITHTKPHKPKPSIEDIVPQ